MSQHSHRDFGVSLVSPTRLQEGVASLSRGTYFREASLDMTLSLLTESAARLSGIERVSIWALTDNHRELRCLERFQLSTGGRSRDGSIRAEEHPMFFAALNEEPCVAADDAYLHPATAGFAVDYLAPNHITAILATPIHIRGELQGALCLEQVGPVRPWTSDYRLFAHAIANLVTLALVEYEAEEARCRASAADERLKALFECSHDAMLLFDASNDQVLDANRQAERLFGCNRRQLAGRSRQQLYRLADDMDDGMPRRAEIAGGEGAVRGIEVTRELAELDGGRRLALEIIRPAGLLAS